jgi:AcrR family transcriptional regulator
MSETAASTASTVENGKARQRRRTRAAIVAAAADLLQRGETPAVGEIAEAADVSRRTVYQHFPNVQQLLIDATVGLLSQAAVDEAIEAADTGSDPAARVTAMIDALIDRADDTLALGRSLISLTVGEPSAPSEPSEPAGTPRRGYRRIGWIERALEPLRDELGEQGYERLVTALAMVVGWEALIVMQDLRALPKKEQRATSQWAARALVQKALSDAARTRRREDVEGVGTEEV